jgi:activating signal cointegrator 1
MTSLIDLEIDRDQSVAKIITLWQPWATLISLKIKNYETRSWFTSYQGELVIHAAKRKICSTGEALLHSLAARGIKVPPKDEIPLGTIVAIANLKDCHQMGQCDYFDVRGVHHVKIGEIDIVERLCGDWRQDRYAWELTHIQATVPHAYKGGQGLRNIDIETVAKLQIF